MTNNYSRGKIYKIVCRKSGLQYFGSTTEPTLARRLAGHVTCFKRWKKGNFRFVTSFTILEENNYFIELVELVPCSSKDELLIRERFHIQTNECINKLVPMRNKEDKKNSDDTYRKNNVIKINERKNEIIICQKCNEEVKRDYMFRHKCKDSNEKCHRDEINEKLREKIECDICKKKINKGNISHHKKTKTCQNYLKNQLENAEKIIRKNIVIENEDL